ncbi:MAG: transglutaminaseTgpA domain-containing protein, partial [Cyanobacteria bacterium J06632_22]
MLQRLQLAKQLFQKRQSDPKPGRLPLLPSRQSALTKTDRLPEESWLLRVLVQGLVTVGICAMTVAAAGVTETSNLNLLAIPLSAAGAYWSWRSRRRRNIAAKFGIALGMLVALGLFFAQLLNAPGDTRVVLAQLLIQLQVLHSFDLPRRKDLGYSMMIGLVLLGVAATISQTLAFGPLLLLFLMLALPVLMLDYRSRLGLLSQGWRGLGGTPKQFGSVLLVTLLLGLVIFAALPRLPGYQLRTFPVSGSVDANDDFDGTRIFNPGYISGGNGNQTGDNGQGNGGEGSGGSPEVGPGRVNTDFYYGFNQRMNQNLRGEMIPKVVMRVRSQTEGFWRVMAFDQYDGQGWAVSRNDSTTTIPRSPISYQFLPRRLPRLGPAREVVQTYTMVNDFLNLLPVMYEPKEVYFPSEELAVDPEGAIRAPAPMAEGTTYTVVSVVTARRPDLLNEASTDYSDVMKSAYLQLPEGPQARIRAEAERLLATAPEPITTAFGKAEFLAQTLKENYSIQEDLPFFDENEDLVEAFLFRYQGGTPDHFATTLTVMLRSLGIPARLAAGFGPGEFNPFTGFYTVRNTDAYAVTEVFFPQYGWFTFDPIPGHLAQPPGGEDPNPFSVLRQVWDWLANATPAPVANALEQGLRAIAWVIYTLVGLFTRFSGRGWLQVLWVVGLLTGFGFLGWLGWHGVKLWRRRRWLGQLAPMEKLYQQMLQRLA